MVARRHMSGSRPDAARAKATGTDARVSAVETALRALRREYAARFNAGDADGVAALHTDATVHLPPGLPPVHGRDAVRALMQQSIRAMPPGHAFTFDAAELRIADGWAAERGTTPGIGGAPGGKYVMLYERDADGVWRIAWTIANSDAAPPPG
jgi:uncharacterized protein (TIGR02246 family)